jgi:hypothetical protein
VKVIVKEFESSENSRKRVRISGREYESLLVDARQLQQFCRVKLPSFNLPFPRHNFLELPL